ncbi:MerR family DNA-binding transcriptional regulator, partial [Litoreibacter halocynthiae]|uniref:MerR family DNA-binding transcriptional regulator n=1 Tax=Litoreibacter halocynthiae TaxID=1242689 RepID=UPI0024920D1D
MNIGEVAERAGLPAKTIRYYEDIKLIRPARDGNGYRAFSENDLHKLTFLSRARA